MNSSRRPDQILAEREGRRVLLTTGRDGRPLVVRTIDTGVVPGPDSVARVSALRLLRGQSIAGLALVEECAIVGRRVEIVESFIDGFSLAEAAPCLDARMSVSVALSLVLDVAQGLAVLHNVKDPHGASASLIHGRVSAERLRLSRLGETRLVGLEGLRGDPSTDVQAAVALLQTLLRPRASSEEGRMLVGKLAELQFGSAAALRDAIRRFLGRLDSRTLLEGRVLFTSKVLDDLATPPTARKFVGPPPLPEFLIIDAEPAADEPATFVENLARESADLPSHSVDSIKSINSINSNDPGGPADPKTRDAVLGPAATAHFSEISSDLVLRSRPRIGRYRVLASIGRGGMGEIYLAKDERTGKLVALKVLAAEDADDNEALGMLMDEAAIMARIDHPNVLKIIDFGRDGAEYHLATEYLEGRPLVRVMIDAYQQPAGLPYEVIASIGADACLGLFAAHTATSENGDPLEVVHRDVSPQNIFVTHRGVGKVIDFGVARASERISSTAIGVVKGKAAYMSPEQAEGARVDARSDVFSLGVCLWEMTAGRRLFKRESEYETLMAVTVAPVESPTELRGNPNPSLDAIILKALERNKRKRIQTTREFAERLMDFCQRSHVDRRHDWVSRFMSQLYGDVAHEERRIITALDTGGATLDETNVLQSISGVAPRAGRGRQITVAAEPSGLLLLDQFGELRPAHVSADTTKKRVEAANRSTREDGPARIGDFDSFAQDEELLEAALRAAGQIDEIDQIDQIHPEEEVDEDPTYRIALREPQGELEILQAKRAARPSRAEPVGRIYSGRAPEILNSRDHRTSSNAGDVVVAEGSVEQVSVEQVSVEQVSVEQVSVEQVSVEQVSVEQVSVEQVSVEQVSVEQVPVAPVLSSSWALGPIAGFDAEAPRVRREHQEKLFAEASRDFVAEELPPRPSSHPEVFVVRPRPWYSVAGVILVCMLAAVAGVFWYARSSLAPEPPAQDSEPHASVNTTANTNTNTDTYTDTGRDTNANNNRSTSARTSTTASFESFVDGLARSQVEVTVSDGLYLLTDTRGGEALVHQSSRVQSLSSQTIQGYLVTAQRPTMTSVVWVGGAPAAPFRVFNLSINDCPAQAEIRRSTDIEVLYPRGGLVGSLESGRLVDVGLDVPEGVESAEIVELGLGFGRRMEGLDLAWCQTGWWGRRLVLRRLLLGRYTVRWLGGGSPVQHLVVVGERGVEGADEIRVQSLSLTR